MNVLPQDQYRQMNDQDFASYLKMLRDSLKDLPEDTQTVYAWRIFLWCVERFGRVEIHADLAYVGRTPDEVMVTIGYQNADGPFPEAMIAATLMALEGTT